MPRIVSDLMAAHEDGEALATICRDALTLGLSDHTHLADVITAHAPAYSDAPPQALVASLLGQAQET